MRLVDGADIGALLDTYGRIAPQRAVYLIGQVAEALDAAHADHLVHRDIKPSNILVTSSDFVYVVDFGIARSIGGRQTPLTHTGAYIGTLDYMAPERFIGHEVDGRADVYSLACLLHECLTGAPPFSGKDLPALMYAQLYFGPPEASSLVEGVPPALDAVIARGMAKDPKDRFQAAGALAAAAREALLAEAPTPQLMELQHTWTEIPDPALPAAPPPQPGQAWRSRRVPNRSQQANPPHGPSLTVPTQRRPRTALTMGTTHDHLRTCRRARVWIQTVVAYHLAWRQAGRRAGLRGAGLACRFWSQPRHWQSRSCSSSWLPLGTKTGGASAGQSTSQRARLRRSHGGGDDIGRGVPQLRSGRAERPVRLHHQSRYTRDHRAQHGH